MLINVEELIQARKKAEEELNSYDCRVLVCSGTGCIATGSQKIYDMFCTLLKDKPGVSLEFAPHDKYEGGDKHVGVKQTGCQGFCQLGPLVRIQKGDKVIQYVKVQPEDCEDIIAQSVIGDEVIERLLYHKGEQAYVAPDEIPFIAKQTRIVLENCGKFDAESLDEYLASGGFEALRKAMFEMTRDEVIDDSQPYLLFDPNYTWKRHTITDYEAKPLQVQLFDKGVCIHKPRDIEEIRRIIEE